MPAEQPKEVRMENTPIKEPTAEPLRRKKVHHTAEFGIKVRKLWGRGRKDLFKVQSLKNQNDSFLVDLNTKTCDCPDFTHSGAKCRHIEAVESIDEIHRQKHREYQKKYYQNNKDKQRGYMRTYMRKYRQEKKEEFRKYKKEWARERYHSDPEFRRRLLEAKHKARLKRREDYNRFKIEFGGKCSICGEDDLDVLETHHPDRRGEKQVLFIHTKEFRDWMKNGIKPDAFLMCSNHHRKLHILETRGIIPPNCRDLDLLRNVLR